MRKRRCECGAPVPETSIVDICIHCYIKKFEEEEEDDGLSSCCSAEIYEDTDICTKCKEHI